MLKSGTIFTDEFLIFFVYRRKEVRNMVWSQRAARVCLPMIAFCLLIFGWWLVTNEDAYAGYDTTAPKLNGVTFSKSVIKPGILKVTLDITEEETGTSFCQMQFNGKSGDSAHFIGTEFNWRKSSKFTGKHTVYLKVSSRTRSEPHYLCVVDLADQAGNSNWYSWHIEEDQVRPDSESAKDVLINGKACTNEYVTVKDEFDVDFQTYITNSATTAKIKAMPEGQAASILFDSGNSIAKKEWFDAIKGKNKTLVFSNDGIQWVFNGKNIVNPTKDIDLHIKIKRASGDQYDDPNDVIEIAFADNGLLPGKARIRLRAGYISTLMNINHEAFLYYINQYAASLESDDVTSIPDGSKYWCEFYVTHNSDFVVSSKKIKTTTVVSGGTVRIVSGKKKTAAFAKAKNKKNVVIPATAKIKGKVYKVTRIEKKAFTGKRIRTVTVGKNVKKISKYAFKGSKATKMIVKSKKLSDVKGSLKGSRIKTIKVKVGSKKANKKYVKKYKKLFRKSYSGKKVSLK